MLMLLEANFLAAALLSFNWSAAAHQDNSVPSDWESLQTAIAEFNDAYYIEAEQEYLTNKIKGKLSVSRDASGNCTFSMSRHSDSITESGSSLVDSWSVASFQVLPEQKLVLLSLPFQPASDEPLPADFAKNGAVGVMTTDGQFLKITSKKTLMDGRELIDDPTETAFFVYDKAVTADINGEVRSTAFLDIMSDAASQCGVSVVRQSL